MAAKGKPDAPIGGVADVLTGLKVIAECVRDIQHERTEQTRLTTVAGVEIARIHAMRDVLLESLDRSFTERRANFEALFARLDSAFAKNDVQLAGVVLDSVVKLAATSPFQALADVGKARAALGEKGKEWKF
jgi:hypothetical protein